MRYICQICGYVYDEEQEGIPFASLPDTWTCPMCKAPKSMFAPQDEEKEEEATAETIESDGDLEKLSPGALAALFSNLARGMEKQYKAKESEQLLKLSEYFTASVPEIKGADLEMIRKLSEEDIGTAYPAAKASASRHKDRGAMRACVWGEKVERIIQALLDRYAKEGESFLEGNDVWVCSVCGFVYIGENPPSICPVCKVPDWKFGKIG